MRLAKLSEFRSLIYAPESAPSLETLRARIRRGEIPGGLRQGRSYYVDLDEFDRIYDVRSTIEERRRKFKEDPLLKGLI
jgi:hypothetical protein